MRGAHTFEPSSARTVSCAGLADMVFIVTGLASAHGITVDIVGA